MDVFTDGKSLIATRETVRDGDVAREQVSMIPLDHNRFTFHEQTSTNGGHGLRRRRSRTSAKRRETRHANEQRPVHCPSRNPYRRFEEMLIWYETVLEARTLFRLEELAALGSDSESP